MRVLLDTHIFIWWDSEPERLSPRTLATLEAHTLVLSVASVWEMQIKFQTGKLDLERPLMEIIEIHQLNNKFELLPIRTEHIFGLQALPLHHKDPFDRLIIAQAVTEGLTVVSVDSIFPLYPIPVLN